MFWQKIAAKVLALFPEVPAQDTQYQTQLNAKAKSLMD